MIKVQTVNTNIDSIEYWVKKLDLREPYTIAYETVDHCENVFMKINGQNGKVGWGCVCPDEFITGESSVDIVARLEDPVREILRNRDPLEITHIMEELSALLPGARSTRALVDMALYDFISRNLNLPLYKYLGVYRKCIHTSITIGICNVSKTIEKAKQYLSDGFKILKLKGGLDVEEDLAKIKQLRNKFGHSFALRFDANQGYNIEDSQKFIKDSSGFGVEILEQPCKKENYALLKEITGFSAVPVMADESLFDLSDAVHLASNQMSDMLNIKLMKVGGIKAATHINSVAKSAGLEVMMGCLDESALGISAGLHFALSKQNIHFADLDGHLDLVADPFESMVKIKHGMMYPTDFVGLGEIKINAL